LFALQTQAKFEHKAFELIEIANARQQVVAGMNYQFELTVKNGENLHHAMAIVFRDLDSQ
jgi:transcriptional regulator